MLPRETVRSLFRFDGIITAASGLLMMLLPQLLIDLLQLGSIAPMWVRTLGVVWLLFGLWLLTLWNAPYSRGAALFSAIMLALNGDVLLLALLFGNFGVGVLGTIAMIGTALFIFYVAAHWWFVVRPNPAALAV